MYVATADGSYFNPFTGEVVQTDYTKTARQGWSPPILDNSSHKVPQDYGQVFARKHSCRMIWCKDCYPRRISARHAERMRELDYTKTRSLTLTLDRKKVGQGEAAYKWLCAYKPRGRFIQNLTRAGIKVEDWTSNQEWHSDGTTHFHMLAQVDSPGKDGMIGNDVLLKCWPWGMVHEGYFKNEKHFNAFVGYFGKTGYLHKDKHHQVELPKWAKENYDKIGSSRICVLQGLKKCGQSGFPL